MKADTLLLRQAHPNFIQYGTITSQVFLPFPKDDGRLSVYDGSLISPEESHAHYTGTLNYASHSVWGVTKLESDNQSAPAASDPQPDFSSHAVLEFTDKDKKALRKVAKKLQEIAMARGVLFMPQQSA